MTETQPFHFNDVTTPSVNNLVTPSRRGHSHRRSFAISGDFEFLKQPSTSVPPLLRSDSPDPLIGTTSDKYMTNHFEQPTNDRDASNILTPRKISHGISSPSPRFFISEEPRFSSPIKGVPDAIINLDDALKTRPTSFKSHRRSESAPADLQVLMDFKNARSIPDFKIEEEESSDRIIDELDSDTNEDKERDNHVPLGLMSPLRPSSPSFQNYESRDPTISPTRVTFHPQLSTPSNNLYSNKYNSLKIKRQKQRYYHYTKQLPTNISNNTQSQILIEKKSSTSLISSESKTPASIAGTPTHIVNTPVTPLSFKEYNNTSTDNSSGTTSANTMPVSSNGSSTYNHLYENRGPKSPDFPLHQQTYQKYQALNNYMNRSGSTKSTRKNSGHSVSTSFKFQSKTYDMPIDSNSHDNQKEAQLTTDNLNATFDDTDAKTKFDSKEYSHLNLVCLNDSRDCSKEISEGATLSMDILMGEPGDKVDLSSKNNDIINGLQNFSINSSSNSTTILQKSKNDSLTDLADSKSRKTSKNKSEIVKMPQVTRSPSDSIVGLNNIDKGINSNINNKSSVKKKKKKSKFSIFTNLFSKN